MAPNEKSSQSPCNRQCRHHGVYGYWGQVTAAYESSEVKDGQAHSTAFAPLSRQPMNADIWSPHLCYRYLVREQEVGEDGPRSELEVAVALVPDGGAGDVRRHEVRRELDAREIHVEGLREISGGQGAPAEPLHGEVEGGQRAADLVGDDRDEVGARPERVLRELANQTGGQMFFPQMSDLRKFYQRLADELRHQYVLGYVPLESASRSRWRPSPFGTPRCTRRWPRRTLRSKRPPPAPTSLP